MPPLNALRAFEAAARHGSFARAADELGVTPAAVSHQIKSLEEAVGYDLFVRHQHGLHLTDVARSALPAFSAAFDALGLAVHDLRLAGDRTEINIAALPAIAQLWVSPRLPALRKAFPKTTISVHALESPPDFRREPFDIGVFYVSGNNQPDTIRMLEEDVIFPVCSPKTAGGLLTPADLRQQTLLHDAVWITDWPRWLAAAGVTGVVAKSGPRFSLYSLALEVAREGGGVLMGHRALVAPLLQSGQLVRPFEQEARTGLALAFLVPEKPHRIVADMLKAFAPLQQGSCVSPDLG
jgi:LysR family glycine cleavage system transcriptional activator